MTSQPSEAVRFEQSEPQVTQPPQKSDSELLSSEENVQPPISDLQVVEIMENESPSKALDILDNNATKAEEKDVALPDWNEKIGTLKTIELSVVNSQIVRIQEALSNDNSEEVAKILQETTDGAVTIDQILQENGELLDPDELHVLLSSHLDSDVYLKKTKQLKNLEDTLREIHNDISEDEDPEIARQKQTTLAEDIGKLIEEADVPGFISMFFALDSHGGFGSSRNLRNIGKERESNEMEKKTLQQLATIFSDEEKAKVFLSEIFGEDGKDLSEIKLSEKVMTELSDDVVYDEMQMKEWQKKMKKAFDAVSPNGFLGKEMSEQEIDIASPKVREYLLLQTEKFSKKMLK